MSGDLVLHSTDEAFTLADRVAKSGLVPQAYRNKPADTAIAMLYGAEMGMPPMSSLQRVVVINGKPTMDAQGMTALIRQAGHSVTGEMSSTVAKVTGKRGDTGDTMTVTYTIEDAKTADLVKRGSPWEKFAEDMLWARAVSRLGRRLFADVLLGVSYVPEEMEAVVASNGHAPADPVDPQPTIDKARTVRKPPGSPDVDEGTGEIFEAELVPSPDELMHELAGLIKSQPETEGDRLAEHLREQFGPAGEMAPEVIPQAIEIAKGWPGTAPDDGPREEESF